MQEGLVGPLQQLEQELGGAQCVEEGQGQKGASHGCSGTAGDVVGQRTEMKRSVLETICPSVHLQCPRRTSQGKFLQDRSSLTLCFQMLASCQHRAAAARAASTNPGRNSQTLSEAFVIQNSTISGLGGTYQREMAPKLWTLPEFKHPHFRSLT